MSKFARDLTVAAAIAAAILISLVTARLLTAGPAPDTEPAADRVPAAATDMTTSRPPPAATSPTTTTAPPPSDGLSTSPPPPRVSMVLSGGVQVAPGPASPPRTYRVAPTGQPAGPPTPPPATPDPGVYDDPAALGAAWLAAICWYDYRDERDANTHRAAAYGDTSLPPGRNPWALDDPAWTRITAGHLGSGCTDITATPAHAQQDGVDQDTVTLTATQVLTVAGTAYQAIPISLTRTLRRGPDGHWLIGPAVTAN